mmetsp:Transcript_34/g.149  ORF Transcript_34/g.149 Transcript_34/m.149 type:complete len:89 (-) Transcript_34:311-577(-)
MSSQPDMAESFADANGSVGSEQQKGEGRNRAPSFVGRYDYITGQSEGLGSRGEAKGADGGRAAAALEGDDDDDEDGVIRGGKPFTMQM